MVACICGGVIELTIAGIFGLGGLVSCCICKFRGSRKKDCDCECHKSKEVIKDE